MRNKVLLLEKQTIIENNKFWPKLKTQKTFYKKENVWFESPNEKMLFEKDVLMNQYDMRMITNTNDSYIK